MVKQYVMKPVVVDAVQYDGTNFDELVKLAGNALCIQDGWIYLHKYDYDDKMQHKTGDYLVKEANGKLSFCEKHAFEKSYDSIDIDRSYIGCQSVY